MTTKSSSWMLAGGAACAMLCVLGCSVPLPAEREVICKLAYGDTPVDEARRRAMTINDLLAWQHWVTAPPLHVKAGATP